MQIAVLCPFINPVSLGYAEGVIEHLMSLKIDVLVDAHLFKGLETTDFKEQLNVFTKLILHRLSNMCWRRWFNATSSYRSKRQQCTYLGINTGRLGFLTSLQKESLNKGLQLLWEKKYRLVKRTLLVCGFGQSAESFRRIPLCIK